MLCEDEADKCVKYKLLLLLLIFYFVAVVYVDEDYKVVKDSKMTTYIVISRKSDSLQCKDVALLSIYVNPYYP